MRNLQTLVVAGCVVAIAACHPTESERAIVRRYLLCEECNRGELEAVAVLGDHVLAMLANALKGPPETGRAYIRSQSEERFKRLIGPASTSAAYVAHYDSNYVALYQAHAATALGRIGSPAARATLYEAMRNDSLYRSDVIRAFSTGTPLTLDTVTPTIQAAPRGSAVRIDPTVWLRDTIGHHAVSDLRVVFTVDSGGGKVSDSVQRTAGNGTASTHWTLGNGPDSVNVLRATTFRHNVVFRAIAHGSMPRLVFLVQPTNTQLGQPINPAVKVAVVDAWDQPDTTLTGSVEATIVPGGVTVTARVDSGRVHLPPIVPNKVGTGLQIVARLTGATAAVSATFNVP